MKLTKLFIGLGLVAIAIVMLLFLIKYAGLLAFFFVYPWGNAEMAQAGVNPYLGQAVSIILSVMMWLVVIYFLLKKGRRVIGFFLLALTIVAQSFFMYLVTSEIEYSPWIMWGVLFSIPLIGVFISLMRSSEFNSNSKAINSVSASGSVSSSRSSKKSGYYDPFSENRPHY